MTTPRHDFWKRFSLRGLFLLMTLACVLLGLWSLYVAPFRRQANAIAALERLPIELGVVPEEGPAWQRWLVTATLGDKAYVRVEHVGLRGPNIDDKVMKELVGLDRLMSLDLEQTQVSDVGLSVLRSLPQLRELKLTYSQATDAGLEQLQHLPQLEDLKLTGTRISDAAVPALAKLPSLRTLYVRWTRITDEGAARLRELAPKCEVFHHELAAK